MEVMTGQRPTLPGDQPMYSLQIWQKPNSDEIRIYINGTSRQSVYFKLDPKCRVVWSSKANDTPRKFQSGDHYGKIKKDANAADEVAEAYGFKLGDGTNLEDWDRMVQIAKDGIQISEDAE
jgi:hypothetical protein